MVIILTERFAQDLPEDFIVIRSANCLLQQAGEALGNDPGPVKADTGFVEHETHVPVVFVVIRQSGSEATPQAIPEECCTPVSWNRIACPRLADQRCNVRPKAVCPTAQRSADPVPRWLRVQQLRRPGRRRVRSERADSIAACHLRRARRTGRILVASPVFVPLFVSCT